MGNGLPSCYTLRKTFPPQMWGPKAGPHHHLLCLKAPFPLDAHPNRIYQLHAATAPEGGWQDPASPWVVPVPRAPCTAPLPSHSLAPNGQRLAL